jgi:preprotein translocase subunit SecD
VRSGEERAWPSIRDSNSSTLITCLVLYLFGQAFGATIIMGFAVVLALGVLVSLFSALFVTRTFLEVVMAQPWARNTALFGMPLEALRLPVRGPRGPHTAGYRG